MSGVLAICDALAAFIETDASKRDDTRVRPAEYLDDILYLWPSGSTFQSVSAGPGYIERFDIRVAWAAERKGEGDPDRSVTDEIEAKAVAAWAAVAAHPSVPDVYDDAHFEQVDYESLTAFDARGFIASIRGHVLRSG